MYTYNQKETHTFNLRNKSENFLRQDWERQVLRCVFDILFEQGRITEEEVFQLKLLVETEVRPE